MNSVKEVIEIIKKSNYFEAWKEILLGENSVEEWISLLSNPNSMELYNILGEKLHINNIPYVIINEYIDEFFRHYKLQVENKHDIKNNIAEAFLNKKLQHDSDLIQDEINKKLSSTLESKKVLINAHLKWMQCFIGNIISKPCFFELDPRKCYVGKWILEENAGTLHPKIIELHSNLHNMASSAIRMYKQNDYAYFLLLYTDVLMSSYQIRDIIMNIYFSKRLTSIYQDTISEHGNYFKLRDDIKEELELDTLLILNIKEFSKINLLYGHEVGDGLIRDILSFIINECHANVNIYRIYGDEFAILFNESFRETVLKILKPNLEKKEFDIRGDKISLSFYGAIATASHDALEKCEYGLMLSKAHYGEIIDVDAISEESLHKHANNISIAQELRLAFMDNRIIPYYQPILDLKTQKITKYEVLMRVKDINANILSPSDFLDVLYEMYIYPEVTKLLIKKAFEFFEKKDFEFSINLSFADIINLDTEAFIIAMLKEYPEVASRCTFELLENEAIHNHQEVREFFDVLHSYGVKLALDDFGAGYSNYETIFKFDIDYIKIDGSLTESLLTSERSKVLMESIVTVAKKLDAKLIVEFVSSKELFDSVSEMDVDYVQGYYIGKPQEGLV